MPYPKFARPTFLDGLALPKYFGMGWGRRTLLWGLWCDLSVLVVFGVIWCDLGKVGVFDVFV